MFEVVKETIGKIKDWWCDKQYNKRKAIQQHYAIVLEVYTDKGGPFKIFLPLSNMKAAIDFKITITGVGLLKFKKPLPEEYYYKLYKK